MPNLTKAFFLARNPLGPDPYQAVNHLPLQSKAQSLALEKFEPGTGPLMQAFLTGDIPTGELKPRKLPREVANAAAHIVNEHRHSKNLVDEPGYVIQVVVTGGPELHWRLEKLSIKAGRFDTYYAKKIEPAINAAMDQGKKVVLKSDFDNLRIKDWNCKIYYSINVITFGSSNDMQIWYDGGRNTSKLNLKTIGQWDWFEVLDWLVLPDAIVQQLDSGARELVFPTMGVMAANAFKASPGPIYMLPFIFLYEFLRERSARGIENRVHNNFKAYVKVAQANVS